MWYDGLQKIDETKSTLLGQQPQLALTRVLTNELPNSDSGSVSQDSLLEVLADCRKGGLHSQNEDTPDDSDVRGAIEPEPNDRRTLDKVEGPVIKLVQIFYVEKGESKLDSFPRSEIGTSQSSRSRKRAKKVSLSSQCLGIFKTL